MMTLSGVRSSCDMVATKSDLIRLGALQLLDQAGVLQRQRGDLGDAARDALLVGG